MGRVVACGLAFVLAALGARAADPPFTVTEDADRVRIVGPVLEAAVAKRGYVSGVAAGSFVDVRTGTRDRGYGLDIVDWLLEPGSDAATRAGTPKLLHYDFNDPLHGKIDKRSVEGPQICTQAKSLAPKVLRGKDFVGVTTTYTYPLAAAGKKAGSVWTQTLVFPAGKRYFLAADKVTTVNASDALFLRTDLPGHIKHQKGDTFSEIYLSYFGMIPANEFATDFPPDAKFLYRRDDAKLPERMIRAYHSRDPKTGKSGPWLAGMTLDPAAVSEAWCHERGYVCMIQEIGGRPVKPGDTFGAAYVIGYFDSVRDMERVYDQYRGTRGLKVDASGYQLTTNN
jgi:hypothetical protein